jgi:hypothetical protein
MLLWRFYSLKKNFPLLNIFQSSHRDVHPVGPFMVQYDVQNTVSI